MYRKSIEQARQIVKQGGIEIALRVLTLEGYLRWAKGELLMPEDFRGWQEIKAIYESECEAVSP